jgi:pimeloyl-ACP methyl ester carboxylesterase
VNETLTTLDGRKLSYRRVGTGPVLVCHPGGGLGESFTLVMLDPRGTGGSGRPADPGAYRIDDYVADLEELRVHLRLERILLLGWSHGAVVALSYAIAHPDRVERLVVVGGAARFGEEQLGAIEDVVARREGEPWFPRAKAALELESSGVASEEELRQAMADMMPLYFCRYDGRAQRYAVEVADDVPNADAMGLWETEIFTTFDLRSRLPSIRAPTLVITGEDDFVTGPTCAREVAALVPAAELAILPECGHMLWVEQRYAFVRAVTRFLLG